MRVLRVFSNPRLLALAFLGGLFSLLAWSGWRAWPDAFVDYGQELYVPWRLVNGEVLYRDLAFLKGPLSSYTHALVFSVLGVSVTALLVFNLFLVAVLALLIFRYFEKACGLATATLCATVFLGFFAFGHPGALGGYNWVGPYSHDLVHGLFLAVAMLFFLQRAAYRPDNKNFFLWGLFLGLVLLTKVEAGLAALAATAAGFFLMPAGRRGFRKLVIFIGGGLLPLFAAVLFFSQYMGLGPALESLTFGWQKALFGGAGGLSLYSWGMGADRPLSRIWGILLSTGWTVLLFFYLLLAAGLSGKGGKSKRGSILLTALFISGFALGMAWRWEPWFIRGQGLTLVLPLAGAGFFWYAIKAGHWPEYGPRGTALATWLVFSWVLLVKIFLQPSFGLFGFALAMPGALILVVLFVRVLPGLAKAYGGSGRFISILVFLVILSDVFFAMADHRSRIGEKTWPLGRGHDRVLALPSPWAAVNPGGPCLEELLSAIEEQVPRDKTFLALPEGVILNYLTRRRQPSRYLNFMPTEFVLFGPDAIFSDIKENPPDYVVLIPRDTREFGAGFFGQDPEYGGRIMDWTKENYTLAWKSSCFTDLPPDYAMRILKRK